MGSNIEDSTDMSLYSPVLSPRQSKNWEQPIFTTKAHVFQIDPNTKKKWLPASSSAINVSYYFDSSRNTYRIISVEGSKAVINSTITPNMTFTKTSQKFGQWSDNRANTVYGLGFSTEQDLLKFVEKFKEVKELTRAGQAKVLGQTNGTSGSGDINHVHQGSDISNSPQNSPLPAPSSPLVVSVSQNDSVNIDRKSSGSPSLPNSGSNVVEQLKYENDRLKIALAQSSANAKKWEVELQTLKNNNARLTTALQESTTNVEEWKKQLAAYKEESARMKKKVLEMEKSGGGSELLQRQITDLREKCNEMEKIQQNKDDDIMNLKKQINELRLLETTNKKLNDKILTVESEKDGLRKQTDELKHQVDIVKAASIRDKQTLRAIQEQLGSKINELYEMNDKLADVLQQNH